MNTQASHRHAKPGTDVTPAGSRSANGVILHNTEIITRHSGDFYDQAEMIPS